MLRYPVTFGHSAPSGGGTFTFNEHLSAVGDPSPTAVQNTVVLDGRQIDTAYRDLRDPLHLAQGGQLGRVHKGMKIISLRGRILVPDSAQQSRLSDRERDMMAAFDPYLCYRDSPSTDGAYALDFQEDTGDTFTYAGGRMPLRYYCRPTSEPRLDENLINGASRAFSLALIAGDPRLYEQTQQTLVLTPGAPTGNVTNRGTTAAPLKVTILMAGAGNVAFTITRAGVAFILDLTGLANGNSVVVIHETSGPFGEGKTVKVGGVNAFSRKTSTPSTWLDAPVGTTSFTITNTTNVTSATLAWYSARA